MAQFGCQISIQQSLEVGRMSSREDSVYLDEGWYESVAGAGLSGAAAAGPRRKGAPYKREDAP